VEEKCFVFSGMAFRAPSLFFSAFHFQKLFVFLWIENAERGVEKNCRKTRHGGRANADVARKPSDTEGKIQTLESVAIGVERSDSKSGRVSSSSRKLPKRTGRDERNALPSEEKL